VPAKTPPPSVVSVKKTDFKTPGLLGCWHHGNQRTLELTNYSAVCPHPKVLECGQINVVAEFIVKEPHIFLKLADNVSVSPIGEILKSSDVNVVADEPNSAVAD
jgi:hypothetical protein